MSSWTYSSEDTGLDILLAAVCEGAAEELPVPRCKSRPSMSEKCNKPDDDSGELGERGGRYSQFRRSAILRQVDDRFRAGRGRIVAFASSM